MSEAGDLIAFVRARLDEAERTVYAEGSPPNGVIAWLTYLEPDGSMGYATVAHGGSEDGPWITDGRELPEPASVLVVHDPARVLREVEAKRRILNDRWGGPDHEEMWQHHVRLLAAVYSGHPDYRQAWKP